MKAATLIPATMTQIQMAAVRGWAISGFGDSAKDAVECGSFAMV
jgi:hypothetical protein